MAAKLDALIEQNAAGVYDIQFDENGDILTEDFFDTAIKYSLFGEQRASALEVLEPQLRRGWIGNEGKDYENGSKLWLFEQARITRSNLNKIENEAVNRLQWLIDDGFAVQVNAAATLSANNVLLEITTEVSRSKVEKRYYVLWKNTGVR